MPSNKKERVKKAVDELQTKIEEIWLIKFPLGSVPDSLLAAITHLRNEVNTLREDHLMKGYNLPDNVSPSDPEAPWNEEEENNKELDQLHEARHWILEAYEDGIISDHELEMKLLDLDEKIKVLEGAS